MLGFIAKELRNMSRGCGWVVVVMQQQHAWFEREGLQRRDQFRSWIKEY